MESTDKTTTDLMNEELENIDSFEDFRSKHESDFIARSLTDFIIQTIIKKDLEKADVIKRADFERTYGYQILNGRRKPNRKNLIQLSFGLRLNRKEAAKLFKIAGHAALHPKIKDEAAAIFCLNKGYTYLEYLFFLDET